MPHLEVGLRRQLHVRVERVSTETEACRVLYVSDIHLRRGRSLTLSEHVYASAVHCRPDVVLLGGDLVDNRSELAMLGDLIGKLREVAPVLAIGGNHDRAVGLELVRGAVEQAGGEWIHDRIARVVNGGRVITVSGPGNSADVDGQVRILCAHNPRVWKRARHAGYDLVLAGHLHGCQLVAWEHGDRLFPGAFFYPYCFLSHRSGRARLVVSRGVSDLVPIRWKCPREVVLCYV